MSDATHSDGSDEQAPPERKLNLGCGEDYRDDYHNVDIDPEVRVDTRLDLQQPRWPYPDDHFEEILVDNLLEHIEPRRRPSFLSECRRILDDGGEMIVRLPTRTGWDVTHYAVPSYRWPHHPAYGDDWTVVEVSGQKVGPGKLMPETVALFCTRYDLVWCLSQVEIRVR